MKSKLTLHLEKNVIEQIKIYALEQECSVSELTEHLYEALLSRKKVSALGATILQSLGITN